MLRSLYSGISGMKVNQTKMDVIGNNIANVGTTSFKSSRVRFQDMLSQNVNQALSPGRMQGGTNPRQVGLGVQLAGIDTVVSQGMMQPTGRNLDVAMDGDGYLMVAKSEKMFDNTKSIVVDDTAANAANHTVTNANGAEIMYTRDGALTLDSEGNLLTPDGFRVLGYSVTDGTNESIQNVDDTTTGIEAGTIHYVDSNSKGLKTVGDGTLDNTTPDANKYLKTLRVPDQVYDDKTKTYVRVKTFNIEKDGALKAVLEDGRVTVLGQVAMTAFKNPAGLTKMGKNLYQASANSGDAVVRTGLGEATANDNSKGYGDMLQGMLEMSNVDLAEQFTDMIVTSRAFQASSKVISTGDEILQDILNLKR